MKEESQKVALNLPRPFCVCAHDHPRPFMSVTRASFMPLWVQREKSMGTAFAFISATLFFERGRTTRRRRQSIDFHNLRTDDNAAGAINMYSRRTCTSSCNAGSPHRRRRLSRCCRNYPPRWKPSAARISCWGRRIQR